MPPAERKTKNIESIFRLSPLQEGLLFHALYAPETGVYFEQFTCVLHGALDPEHFKQAWDAVISRHDAVRALFTWERREHPLQIIRARVQLPITRLDWSDSGDDPHAEALRLESFLACDRHQGFRLDHAPLMRLTLMRLGPDRHRFVWSFHHLILDGWSMRLVLGEVLEAYAVISRGEEPERRRGRSFRDAIAWIARQDSAAARAYFQELLSGFSAPTTPRLPTTPRAAVNAGHGEYHWRLPRDLSARLRSMARRERITLNTVVRGAWALLLQRYCCTEDVVFGATVSGRPAEIEGVERMVGLFINTLPVRARFDPERPVAECLRELQVQQLETGAHEHASLADITRWSDVEPGAKLFESIVVFENLPPSALEDAADDAHNGDGGTASSSLHIDAPRFLEQSNFPLVLLAVPGDELELIVIHDRDRFGDELVARLATHISTVLKGITDAPTGRVADVPMMSRDELHRILVEWSAGTDVNAQVNLSGTTTGAHEPASDSSAERPDARATASTVFDLFRCVVRESPDRVAAQFKGESITYGELADRAARLSSHLLELGVKPEARVCISMERSFEMLMAIIGVHAAGAAYVPLDPRWPTERVNSIARHTSAAAIVTAGDAATQMKASSIPVVRIDADTRDVESEPSAKMQGDEWPGAPSPDDLAYVLFTSGSTGAPKGVEITHASLLHSTRARFEFYRDPVDRFLLLPSFVFDSSVAGIFWTLCEGGTLVLPPTGIEQDIESLGRIIAEARVTHMLSLPSVHELLVEHAAPGDLKTLRTVIVAGEACPTRLVARHRERLHQTALYNEYGPTEATVWCTACELDGEQIQGAVPIGRPIPRTSIVLLDTLGRPVPIGIPGELHVGGAGLARGYLGAPELSAERFREHRLPGDLTRRLYATGDMARWRGDGMLEFLGRTDQQVKVRGYRIELEEIETALRSHEGVRQAAVLAWRHDERSPPGGSLDPAALAERLLALGEPNAMRLLDEIEYSTELAAETSNDMNGSNETPGEAPR